MKTKWIIFLGVVLLFSITFANKNDGQGRRRSKVSTNLTQVAFELN